MYLGDRERILEEVRVLEGDVHLHQCSAESMQARHQGEKLPLIVQGFANEISGKHL